MKASHCSMTTEARSLRIGPNSTYTADVKAALVHIYEHTKTDEACKEWVEVAHPTLAEVDCQRRPKSPIFDRR